MQPRIHVITLVVADLERALAFYRDGLGLESTGIFGAEFAGDETNPDGTVAMFSLTGQAHPVPVAAQRAGQGRARPPRPAHVRRVQS